MITCLGCDVRLTAIAGEKEAPGGEMIIAGDHSFCLPCVGLIAVAAYGKAGFLDLLARWARSEFVDATAHRAERIEKERRAARKAQGPGSC